STPLRDRHQELELLRRRRTADRHDQRLIDDELAGIGDHLDGATLSQHALARLQQLVGRASFETSDKGRSRVTADERLRCTLTTVPGTNTTLASADGTLTFFDLGILVERVSTAASDLDDAERVQS